MCLLQLCCLLLVRLQPEQHNPLASWAQSVTAEPKQSLSLGHNETGQNVSFISVLNQTPSNV